MRMPMAGINVAAIGQETIHGVVGPLASSSMEDIELFQKAVLDQEPWDDETSLTPVPWKTVTPNRSMTVAIMWDDGYVFDLILPQKSANIELRNCHQMRASSSSYHSSAQARKRETSCGGNQSR